MVETQKFTPEQDADPSEYHGEVYSEAAEYEDDLLVQKQAVDIINLTMPEFANKYDISVCNIDIDPQLFPVVVLQRKDDRRKIYPINFLRENLNPPAIKAILRNQINRYDDWFPDGQSAQQE
jgi:hypothetical protein